MHVTFYLHVNGASIQNIIVSTCNDIFYIQIHHFTQKQCWIKHCITQYEIWNKALNLKGCNQHALVADVAKRLRPSCLMVKSIKNQFFQALYNNLVERFPNTKILRAAQVLDVKLLCRRSTWNKLCLATEELCTLLFSHQMTLLIW